MIQGDFGGFEGPDAVCFSEPQFHIGVGAFHDLRVVLLPGREPVEDQRTARGDSPQIA